LVICGFPPLIKIQKNKAEILKLANDRDFGKFVFVEEKASGKKSWKERKIKGVIDDLGDCDRLLVPKLSRLGRSMLEIMEMLSITLLSSSGSCRYSTPATEK